MKRYLVLFLACFFWGNVCGLVFDDIERAVFVSIIGSLAIWFVWVKLFLQEGD